MSGERGRRREDVGGTGKRGRKDVGGGDGKEREGNDG